MVSSLVVYHQCNNLQLELRSEAVPVQRTSSSEKEIAEVLETPYREGMLRSTDGLVPLVGPSDLHNRFRFVDHRFCSVSFQVVREVLVFQIQGTLLKSL